MRLQSSPAPPKNDPGRLLFGIFLTVYLAACLGGGIWGNTGSGSFSIAGFTFIAGRFIFIYAFIWLSLILLFFHFPFQGYTNKNILIVIALAITARCFIFFQQPSDDVYRYLWEGMLTAEGFNPYLLSPDMASLSGFAQQFPYHGMINHPDISAVYPPLMLLLFSLISMISISLFPVKIVMTLFDLGGIFFLISILKKREADIRWSLLYALNPLVLYSFAGDGHFDSIQTFFLLGAVYFYDRKNRPMMFLFAGAAFQVKYVAVIAAFFFINRSNVKWLPVFFIPALPPFVPFLSDGPLVLFNGLLRFEGEFAFNGSIHSVFRILSGEMKTATVICRGLFVVLILLGLYKFNNLIKFQKRTGETDPVVGIFYAFAVLTLLAPTIHFWYLTWILPFAVIRNRISWVVLSLTAGLYFTAKSNAWFGGVWGMPVWAQIMEWGVFYAFFGFEFWYGFVRKVKGETASAETLAVIIPVLNEEEKIRDCIQSIQTDPAVTEIIVVDGGSKDNTITTAETIGATVMINKNPIEDGGGRGGQILTGLKSSTSDIVAVVHSDVIIHSPVFTGIKNSLASNPDVAGGAVGTKFAQPSGKTAFIEFLNGLRTVFFGISFGDQIQFFRREPVMEHDLFPDIPLMEDIEFSLRLPTAGRRIFLFGDASVSSRRWEEKGTANFFMVLSLFFSYLVQRVFRMPDTITMYKKYY